MSNLRMRTTLTLVCTLLAAGTLPATNTENAVLTAQRKWIDSYNHRDEKSLSAIEADDFRVTFGGRSRTNWRTSANLFQMEPNSRS